MIRALKRHRQTDGRVATAKPGSADHRAVKIIVLVKSATTNAYINSNRTFSSWFHARSYVHSIAKETVSWHCVTYNSYVCNKQ